MAPLGRPFSATFCGGAAGVQGSVPSRHRRAPFFQRFLTTPQKICAWHFVTPKPAQSR